MPEYKVWDENSDEVSAHVFEAESAEDAAEQFAEDDVDGHADGIYVGGHEVFVRCPMKLLHRFDVVVEYSPTFYVTEMALKAPAAHPPGDVAADPEA